MSKCEKLLEKAQTAPKGMRFGEVTALAECFGFVLRRSGGGTSHRIYKRPGFMKLLNFQDANGMAKEYQVKELLGALRELGLIED